MDEIAVGALSINHMEVPYNGGTLIAADEHPDETWEFGDTLRLGRPP